MPASATGAEIERFRLFGGDVVITKDSESPDDIAVPAYIAPSIGESVICGYHLAVLRPRPGLDGQFLSYLLRLPEVNLHFARRATGSTRYGLAMNALHSAPLRIPPLREQRRIAEILSTLDEQIEQTEALVEKESLVRTAILTSMVMSSNPPSITIEELASKVGSGVTPTGGSEVYRTSGITFVRSQNVLNEQLDLADAAFITDEIHKGMAGSRTRRKRCASKYYGSLNW